MTRRIALISLVSLLALWPARVDAQRGAALGRGRPLTVMTWNVYHGVDAQIFDVLTATSQPDLYQKVAAVYDGYQASQFAERAKAIARQVARTRPTLIGLQEAILVRTQTPADGPLTPAVNVEIDVVGLILDALAARGMHYQVVVESIGFDAELPSAYGFDVRHTNRDVILARTDLRASDFSVFNASADDFGTNCEIPTALPTLGTVTITRAWASVDVKVPAGTFRLLSTHLEGSCGDYTEAVQGAQIQELLTARGSTLLPLVLVGDLNSPADGTGMIYNALRASGFGDAWDAASVPGAGLTCCQAPDLTNPMSAFYERVDFILYRGDWSARGTRTVGDLPQDRTRTPIRLWPSDHAGVVSRLRLP
jgi:Endonuclease/Exonuclease/phosphatase family